MNNKKKVLIFATSYYPFMAGAEVAIKEITDRINDIDFYMITGRFDKNLSSVENFGNIKIYRVGFGIKMLDKLLLPFLGALYAIYLNYKYHFSCYLCVMVSFASGAAYIANILNFWSKVPIILNIQEGDSEEYLKSKWCGLLNFSWNLSIKRSKKIIVLSEYLKNKVLSFKHNIPILIIPNGVDILNFDIEINQSERNKIREEFGVNENDLLMITVSRLNIKNGLEYVIKALSKLDKRIKFLICGSGELENGLKNLAKELGVLDRVIFKGFVSHKEIPKYLKSSDIFIRPSLSEGFGNSFIEAFVAKIPVIATPVGGIVDFLFDGSDISKNTGYFCKPKDYQSIVYTVNRVIEDKYVNKRINNAYDLAKNKYNFDSIAKEFRDSL